MTRAAPATRWLTIDCGNTTLDLRVATSDSMAEEGRRRLVRRGLEASELGAALDELLGVGRSPDQAVAACAAVGVVDAGLDLVGEALTTRSIPIRIAGRDLACPLEIDYHQPAQLGADRWVGAYAAHREFGAAAIVDCGTAVTIDLVDSGGRFLGGAIGPGPRTMAEGLVAAAPRLPRAQVPVEDLEVPARGTQAAVDLAIAVGFAGFVESVLRRCLDRAGLWEAVLVATGGAAGSLLQHGELPFVHRDSLIHDGLAALLESSPAAR